MRKLSIFALLVILASPALAGNSIRSRFPIGGAPGDTTTNPPGMCLDATCVSGDDVYYDAAADCFYCCDPVADPGCGDFTPCDPADCLPGTFLTWDDALECFACVDPPDSEGFNLCVDAACTAGQALVWDPVNLCFDCCDDPPGPCDFAPCDPTECGDGDTLVWDADADCWSCLPVDTRPHRFLYRDRSDTFTPSFWVVSGDRSRHGQIMYLTAGDNTFEPGSQERGATIILYSEDYPTSSAGDADLYSYGSGSMIHLRADVAGGTTVGTGDTELTLKTEADSTFLVGTAGQMLNIGGNNVATGIDLGAINNQSTATQGLRLPQGPAASLVDPTTSDEGFIFWDQTTDALYCNDGTTWSACGGAGSSYWTPQTNGLTNNVADAVHISADGNDVAETMSNAGFLDAAGDLFVAGQAGIEGNVYTDGDFIAGATTTMSDGSITWSPNLMELNATTSDAADTSTLIISGGGAAENVNRGAYLEVQGNEFAGGAGHAILYSGNVSTAYAAVRNNSTDGSAYLESEDGATDNKFAVSAAGAILTGNSGDNLWLPAVELGFGASTAASAVCLIDDGADRIFHDTDCDGTKDAGEEYIDQAGGGGGGTSVIRFDATALHATEANFAPIDEEAGTNVEYLMTLYGPSTDTCRNGKFPVPPDADLSQSVTMRLWFTGDGTADASGLDVIWYVKISDVDDGESYDTAYATQTFTAETMTTTDDTTMHEITKTFTGTSEMAAGDFIFFAVCRDADNGSDTYDGDARLSYIQWEFPE